MGESAEITYALADFDPADSEGQVQGQRDKLRGESNQLKNDDDSAGLCVENFNIDRHVGVVTAKTKLNYEQRAIYKCRVLAVDAGQPPNTGQRHLLDKSYTK